MTCLHCGRVVTSFDAPNQLASVCNKHECIIKSLITEIKTSHNNIDNMCIICLKHRDWCGVSGSENICCSFDCHTNMNYRERKAIYSYIKRDEMVIYGRLVCSRCDHTFLPRDGNIQKRECFDCSQRLVCVQCSHTFLISDGCIQKMKCFDCSRRLRNISNFIPLLDPVENEIDNSQPAG